MPGGPYCLPDKGRDPACFPDLVSLHILWIVVNDSLPHRARADNKAPCPHHPVSNIVAADCIAPLGE